MELADLVFSINWVDLIILILLIRLSYKGFTSGLSNEVIRTIIIFTSFFIAHHFYLKVGKFLADHTPISGSYSMLIAFLCLIFFSKYVFDLIVYYIIEKNFTVSITTLFDTIGGLILGLVRGVLVTVIVVTLLSITPIEYIRNSVVNDSLFGRKFLTIGETIYIRTSSLLAWHN